MSTAQIVANIPRQLPPVIAIKPIAKGSIRFALLPASDEGGRIKVFASIRQLASAIHRARNCQPLELCEIEDFQVEGHTHTIRAVEVHTLNEGNDRTGYLGTAYLNNQGSAHLCAALSCSLSNKVS